MIKQVAVVVTAAAAVVVVAAAEAIEGKCLRSLGALLCDQ